MEGGRPQAVLGGVGVGGDHPVRVMAVINLSPESFYSGSVRSGEGELIAAAQACEAAGADFIDVGAMSTAPYLDTEIDESEERRRMVQAIRTLSREVAVPLSIDTARASVAGDALAAGARIVNDVRGLAGDGEMARVAGAADGIVLMASPSAAGGGGPAIARVLRDLRAALERAAAASIDAARIVVDPGFGFYRETELSATAFACQTLAGLRQLHALGHPVLAGVSRKSFLGELCGRPRPSQRLAASLAATTIAVLHGAAIIRTHDVAETVDVVRVVAGVAAVAE